MIVLAAGRLCTRVAGLSKWTAEKSPKVRIGSWARKISSNFADHVLRIWRHTIHENTLS